MSKQTRSEVESRADDNRRMLGKEKLKKMARSKVEGLFNSSSLEEIKRNIGALMEVAVQVVAAEPYGCRAEFLKLQKDGEDDQRGYSWKSN